MGAIGSVRSPHGFRFGVFEVDVSTQELRKQGIRLRVPAQSFRVLEILLQRRGAVVTREELHQALWPNQPWGELDARLYKTIRNLREALSDSADTPRYIETMPKVGYRFLVPVEQIADRTDVPAIPQPPVAVKRRPSLMLPAVLAVTALSFGAIWWATTWSAPALPRVREERLTSLIGAQRDPAWSPTGKELAFSWDGENRENADIYVIGVGDLVPSRLTSQPQPEFQPTFSPSGNQIAFLRRTAPYRAAVVVMNRQNRAESVVGEIRWARFAPPSLRWTPKEDWLVTADLSEDGQSACFLLSTADRVRRRLTSPPVDSRGDFAPIVSFDGRMLAFARSTGRQWKEVFVLDLNPEMTTKGQPRQLTRQNESIHEIAWTRDSREVIFTSGPWGGTRYLRRVSALGQSPPERIGGVEIAAREPAVSPFGDAIAFVRSSEQNSLWSYDPATGNATRIAASKARYDDPDWSPDGSRLVFTTGAEIWVARADGSDAKRLVQFPNSSASKPRWSPDGRTVVFESQLLGQSEVFAADVATGRYRNVSNHPGDDFLPSLSVDGATLYFCSLRSGAPEIWRMPLAGGPASQVTRGGGVSVLESPDGKWIYYTSSYAPATLMRVPIEGGKPQAVAFNVQTIPGFAPVGNGVYFLNEAPSQRHRELRYWDARTRRETTLRTFEAAAFRNGLSVSRKDGRVLFSLGEAEDRNIYVFRGPLR